MIKRDYNQFSANNVNKKKLQCVKTSGSQGIPFSVYHDRQKVARKRTDLIFFNQIAGFQIGHKHLLIRTKSKHKILLFLQNELLIIASKRDDRYIRNYIDIIKNNNIRYAIGHPSIMVAIAERINNDGQSKEIQLNGFIGTSEPLLEHNRQLIENTFRCPVIARYSSEELGVIALELIEDKRYHVNVASIQVEILALDSDEPVPVGETGRIVVTDLCSFAMPLIRYDTGDIGALSSEPSKITGGPVFKRIEGRKMDIIYDTNGNIIFPLSIYDCITDILVNEESINSFQVIQKSKKDYLVLLNRQSNVHIPNKIFNRLRKEISSILGCDARITFDCNSNLRVMKSGKQPFIINEFKLYSDSEVEWNR